MHVGESAICDVMQSLRAILTAGLLIAVQGQLFDKTVIEDGGSFKLTCDSSWIANIPVAVTFIYELLVERAWVLDNRTQDTELLARYAVVPSDEHKTLKVPYDVYQGMEFFFKSVPTGRAWSFKGSGGHFDTALNNRATMNIKLHVPDAQCVDAGLYTCKAVFHPTDGVSEASRSDTLTIKARKVGLDVPVLKLDHHNGNSRDVSTNTVGEEVKLTCKLQGPAGVEGLELTWLTGPSGGTDFVPYPTEGAETVTRSPPDHPCRRGKYESTLTLKVQAVDTMYICLAKDGDDGASRKNFTIVPKTSPVNEGSHLGIVDSHWFVRNMLVMLATTLVRSRFV